MSATKVKTSAVADNMTAAAANVTEAATQAADASVKTFEKTISAARESIEKATRGLETSQVKIKESVEKAMKNSEEALAFAQGNMEALVKASQIYAAGIQDISSQMASSSKASIEDSVAFGKSLMGVKSVKEAVDLQTGFTKSVIEKAVSESGKFTDAAVKLAEQALAPLTARVTVAVETFGKAR